MRNRISRAVPFNSYEYFSDTLITPNGFREYDVRWLLGKEINPNGFLLLGRAYGTYAREVLKERTVVLGHDFRSYSQDLSRSLAVGLMSTGLRVIDIGLAMTPMVYYAQHLFGVRAAAMVTASHNENGWCGIKLASGLSATLGPDEISAFKTITESLKFADGSGTFEMVEDVFEKYSADIIERGRIRSRMKVVIAAGNGTAGRFAPAVLKQLGCEVIELDCTADWNFPNHNPNPEDISFLESIGHETRKHGAALGVGIDGDGDRIGLVDETGEEIFSDRLGLLLARWICPQHPGRSLVVDVKSTGLFFDDPVLKASGTNVEMWKTGHSYIKAKVAETNAIAGFEKSGHWFFGPPLGRGYDDALLSACTTIRMLDAVGMTLREAASKLRKTWQSPTLGAVCPDEVKYKLVDEMSARYAADEKSGAKIAGKAISRIITVNGVRFVLENGSWGLIRASSNKPSLVVVAESVESADELYAIVAQIKARLAETGKVGEYDQEFPSAAVAGGGAAKAGERGH